MIKDFGKSASEYRAEADAIEAAHQNRLNADAATAKAAGEKAEAARLAKEIADNSARNDELRLEHEAARKAKET